LRCPTLFLMRHPRALAPPRFQVVRGEVHDKCSTTGRSGVQPAASSEVGSSAEGQAIEVGSDRQRVKSSRPWLVGPLGLGERSLVCRAPLFCLVLGPYWPTFGLRLHGADGHRPGAVRPSRAVARPPAHRTCERYRAAVSHVGSPGSGRRLPSDTAPRWLHRDRDRHIQSRCSRSRGWPWPEIQGRRDEFARCADNPSVAVRRRRILLRWSESRGWSWRAHSSHPIDPVTDRQIVGNSLAPCVDVELDRRGSVTLPPSR
jgi:hypothetical protein